MTHKQAMKHKAEVFLTPFSKPKYNKTDDSNSEAENYEEEQDSDIIQKE